MIPDRTISARSCAGTNGRQARTTIGFAAISDHVRLPGRFFARLCACGGSLDRG
jgi:hypothetical protein